VICVWTLGVDDASVLRGDLLLAAAEETDAVVYLNLYTIPPDARQRIARTGGLLADHYSLWPADNSDTHVIEEMTRRTGGAVRRVKFNDSMVDTVNDILTQFRQRYVLHYQPAGVKPGGWHTLEVRVTRPGKFSIQARNGYFGG
jgi:hypothetical protein